MESIIINAKDEVKKAVAEIRAMSDSEFEEWCKSKSLTEFGALLARGFRE